MKPGKAFSITMKVIRRKHRRKIRSIERGIRRVARRGGSSYIVELGGLYGYFKRLGYKFGCYSDEGHKLKW
jgi:hypothetical protein